MTDTKEEITYSVEYATSNRSKCKKCKQVIPKDEWRFGIWRPSRLFDGNEVAWHHWPCFIAKISGKSKNKCYGSSEIKGVSSLRMEDQVTIRTHFGEITGSAEQTKFREEDMRDTNYFSKEEQNRLVWILSDVVSLETSPSDQKMLLELNDLPATGGEKEKIGRLVHAMLYGVPEKCPECGGHIVWKPDLGKYKCTGDKAWAKCPYQAMSVVMDEFKYPAPGTLCEDLYTFAQLKKEGKMGRIFNQWESSVKERKDQEKSALKEQADEANAAEAARLADLRASLGGHLPLEGLTFCLAGTLEFGIIKAGQRIETYGGKLAKAVGPRTNYLVTTTDEIFKRSPNVLKARSMGVPLVREDIVDACLIVGGAVPATHFLLEQPGAAGEQAEQREFSEKSKKFVDSDPALADFHIYEDGEDFYDVMLHVADIDSGINSYYSMQLLEPDTTSGGYVVLLKWGRVGTDVGGVAKKPYPSLEEAMAEWAFRWQDKTENSWEDRKTFEKKPGRFFPVDREYETQEEIFGVGIAETAPSRLPKQTQDLMATIFSLETFTRTLRDLNIDVKKMPLGALKKAQVEKAYRVLREIETALQSKSSNSDFSGLNSQFYTLIPHDFGKEMPPPIKNLEMLKAKMHLVEALGSVAQAAELMRNVKIPTPRAGLHSFDRNYLRLQTRIDVVPEFSPEHEAIRKYVANTQAPTLGRTLPLGLDYTLEIGCVYKIARVGEEQRYREHVSANNLANKTLLWHGSRPSNVVGILANGLKIAPEEAPHSGYNFGRGLYFSDAAGYSAQYCGARKESPFGFLFLAEVALGTSQAASRFENFVGEQLRKTNKHSVRASGREEPDAAQAVLTDDGVTVPSGPLVRSKAVISPITHDEYVVFSENQAMLRYLVQINFSFVSPK